MEVPKINCLNLLHRTDRRDNAISEFKKQNIQTYQFWTPVAHETAFISISKSHKMIVQHAKNNGDEICCVCEDDISFADIGAWQYFIENIPNEFSLYLSSIYWGEIKEDNTVEDFASLTLYIIHSRYYDTFLKTEDIGHIDRGQKGRGKFVVCNPFVSFQIDGYSDNVKYDTSDYFTKYMVGRKFFSNALHGHQATRSVAENKALIAVSL